MMWFAMDYSAVGAGADLVKLLGRENARTSSMCSTPTTRNTTPRILLA
jgi:hypothetical protein